MDNEFELVKHFVSRINSKELDKLVYLIDPNIIIIDPLSTEFTLETYLAHIAIMVQNFEVELIDIEKLDGIYHIRLKFHILDHSTSYRSTFDTLLQLTVVNGLLTKTNLIVDSCDEDMRYMQKIYDSCSI